MTAEGWSWYNAVRSLVVSERYDAARRSMDLALARARERGAVLDVGGVLTFRSELSLHVGDLASAEVDARTLGEISNVCAWPLGAGFSAAWLGEVLIDRGELEEADRLIAKGPFAGPPATVLDVYPSLWLLLARARLRLAQGRAEDAEQELRECGRRADGIGHFSPTVAPWRSWLARALTELGQTAEARRLAAEELERARAAGDRQGAVRGGTPGSRTARSPRRCSSRRRPWSSTCATRTAS